MHTSMKFLRQKGKQKGKTKAENSKGALKSFDFKAPEVVRVAGFEPTASWTRINVEYSFAAKYVLLSQICDVLHVEFVC